MRQFHSYQKSTFRFAQSYHKSQRCMNFCRNLFDAYRSWASTQNASFRLHHSVNTAWKNTFSLEKMLSRKSQLKGSLHSDASAAQWPHPTKSTLRLLSHGALTSTLFGEGLATSLNGSASVTGSPSGLGQGGSLALLMQADSGSAFIKALLHECGAAALPLETMTWICKSNCQRERCSGWY